MRQTRDLVMVALLVAVGAVVAAATWSDGASSSAPHSRKIPPLGPLTPGAFAPIARSLPPPIAPNAALRRVVVSLRRGRAVVGDTRSDLVSARIGTPPRYPGASATHAVVPALYVTERIPGVKSGGTLESFWEADLLVGAIAELVSKSKSLQSAIGYVDYSGQLPNGKVIPHLDGGMGNMARGQQFAWANKADAAIEHSVERVASNFGLSVDSVRIFRALGAAPAVVLTAPNASTADAKFGSVANALFGHEGRPRYQGYYLEIRGEDGKAYARNSVSYRTGTTRG